MVAPRVACSLFVPLVLLLGALPLAVQAQDATPVTELPAGVSVVASGLTNPRGFTWDTEGTLHLALAGVGGDVEGMVGDTPTGILGGPSASIVTIADGCTTPVAEGLPSGYWVDAGWIWGVMDVAFLGDELYALVAGGGSDFGNPDTPNGVYRVSEDGDTELVADLSAWFRDNPPGFAAPDYNEDGSLFDMEAGEDRLWISEAVGGRLLTVTPDGGEIELIADLSEGHMVPTGVALAPEGGAYVGFETVIPYPDGGSKVVLVSEDGSVEDIWTGLTAVTDIALGPDGELYAAEMATNNLDDPPYLNPNSGRIVRQTGPDSLEPVVTDADYPVMLGFDDAGDLYLTYPAFGTATMEGEGALLQLDLSEAPISLAEVGDLTPSCQGGPGSSSGATPEASPVSSADTQAVDIVDFSFSPGSLEIPAGTTVIWTNGDAAPHTVTATEGAFDSGRLDAGCTFSFIFDEPGTFTYMCEFHPAMQGTITVT